MARMTFSPEKCEQQGASIYQCGTANSLPNSEEGMADSSKTNDSQAIRGICPAGSKYANGQCQEGGE
ncbi:MAG: hypothetical protein Q7T82_01980 [Armatimonadota bacterium]|nr:hypothetical protein [Armatimonadota bacterium]